MSIIAVVLCPDQAAGTDPETLGLAFHNKGPIFFYAYFKVDTNLVYRG